MVQIVTLATPSQRLSVQFREDLEKAVSTEADNQFRLISLVFKEGSEGVTYDWALRQTTRWSHQKANSVTPWAYEDGRRFSYEVGRFFLHEKEDGDEAE